MQALQPHRFHRELSPILVVADAQGYACANDGCEAHYHGYCYDMITERRAPCMQCKCSFFEIRPTPVGEKAVGRAQDDWSRPQKRRRSGPNGRANNINGEEEDEEDEDGDLEEEEGGNQSQGASQSLERRAVREEEGDELESENEASLPVSSLWRRSQADNSHDQNPSGSKARL